MVNSTGLSQREERRIEDEPGGSGSITRAQSRTQDREAVKLREGPGMTSRNKPSKKPGSSSEKQPKGKAARPDKDAKKAGK